MVASPARLCLPLLLLVALGGCTPEQGEAVPIAQLFTNAKLHKKYATVTGVLGISGGIMGSTSCKGGRCTVELEAPASAEKNAKDAKTIRVSLDVGSGENQMAPLPDKYSRKDLKVKAMGGKVLSAGDTVKVSGHIYCHGNNGEDVLPCKMDVDRVDAM